MKLFDTHCHLAGPELKDQAQSLVTQGLAEKVQGYAVIAADFESLRESLSLVPRLQAAFPDAHIIRTAGIHPHDADSLVSDESYAEVERAAQGAHAIGETGLDYHYNHSDRQKQKEVFAWHIDLASRLKKPLVIHCRECVDDLSAMLDCEKVKTHPNPGIIHCFSENLSAAKKFLDLNFMISFSGIVSFKNASALREVVRAIPLNRILVETDAPWLSPVPYRGKQNQPAFVSKVMDAIIAERPEDKEKIINQIWENSCKVYSLKTTI